MSTLYDTVKALEENISDFSRDALIKAAFELWSIKNQIVDKIIRTDATFSGEFQRIFDNGELGSVSGTEQKDITDCIGRFPSSSDGIYASAVGGTTLAGSIYFSDARPHGRREVLKTVGAILGGTALFGLATVPLMENKRKGTLEKNAEYLDNTYRRVYFK